MSSTKIKSFHCNYENCNTSFTRKDYLDNHIRIKHTGEKPFKCNYEDCTAKFSQRNNLTVHIRTHTGEKPYICDYEGCVARYAQKNDLNKHKRRHINDRPYKCNYQDCNASFIVKNHLNTHIRIHNNEKPFICDFTNCDAKFSHKSNLTAHKRTHTGDRPYTCDFEDCDSRFTRLDHLIIHNRIHTGEKPYKCEEIYCDYEASTKNAIHKHKQSIHSINGIMRQKRQEQWIANILKSADINFKREHRINFECINDMDTSYARIDFVIDYCKNGIMFLEIDESQHKFGKYNIYCDLARMSKVIESIRLSQNTLPLLFIRLNSSDYKIDNITKKTTKKLRAERLIKFIQEFEFKNNNNDVQIQYMYYDMNDNEISIHNNEDYNEFFKNYCLPPIF